MPSIVIDTCVMRLYDSPADPRYKELFEWLAEDGKIYVSKKLVHEYISTGNRNIQILLSEMTRIKENIRMITVESQDIKKFNKDKRYKYSCNIEDQWHSKLVFISPRKKLVSQDKKLNKDINKFPKVDGIKPKAEVKPSSSFYS